MKRSAGGAAGGAAKKPRQDAGPPAADTEKLKDELEIYEKFFFADFAAASTRQGLRHDGRKLSGTRPVSVTTGVTRKALGSSLVKQGGSSVICGTRIAFVPALGKNADEGRVEVRCSIPSVAVEGVTEAFTSFQQRGNAIAEYVSRMIQSSDMINLKQLCVEENTCAMNLHVDLYVLSMDGSLRDTCLHAAVSSLMHTTLPIVEVEDSVPTALPGKTRKLDITKYPMSITVGCFQDKLLLDLTEKEEGLVGGFSVVHDSTGRLLNVYRQGGKGRVTEEQLKGAIEAGKAHAKTLKGVIEGALSEKPEPAAAKGGKAAKPARAGVTAETASSAAKKTKKKLF